MPDLKFDEHEAALLRRELVEHHIAPYISDQQVLEAMAAVPRHLFMPGASLPEAYANRAYPISEGQTISQPIMVAMLLEAMQLRSTDNVLDIGTGSGYLAALLSRLAASVITIERFSSLAKTAETRLQGIGCDNVECIVGDGSLGWPKGAPYDAIVVSAASPMIPEHLATQLNDGGRLVVPIGDRNNQMLTRLTRTGETLSAEQLGACVFVPLVGEGGWQNA